MKAPRVGTTCEYRPVGLDLWQAADRECFAPGELVRVVQPGYGCPINGTMGHCFVQSATSGPRLVLIVSLKPVAAAKAVGRAECPTCHQEGALTAREVARGYQCRSCTRREEGYGFEMGV